MEYISGYSSLNLSDSHGQKKKNHLYVYVYNEYRIQRKEKKRKEETRTCTCAHIENGIRERHEVATINAMFVLQDKSCVDCCDPMTFSERNISPWNENSRIL